MPFDPYAGYALGQDIPDYYNPYKAFSASGYTQQQAQRTAQANVPGKDAPTPGSKHGAIPTPPPSGRTVRLMSPQGSIRDIPHDQVNFWIAKGARRI